MTTMRVTTSTAPGKPPTHPRWWKRPWMVPLGLVAGIFLVFSVPRYLTLDPTLSRVPLEDSSPVLYPFVVGHVVFGAIAMITCCLQVWPWLRQTHPGIHRISGRIYVIAGVIPSGILALGMGFIGAFGPMVQTSNVMLSLLWLGFTFAGLRAARQRRYRQHRRWMIRSFALTMSIVINRVIGVPIGIWLFTQVDTMFDGNMDLAMMAVSGVVGWSSWTIALIAAELWLERQAPRGSRSA